MKLLLNTPSTRDPVTLDEVRNQARITGNNLDPIILQAIPVSVEYVEQIMNLTFISKTYTLYLDRFFDDVRIPLPPLQSVTQITYTDTNGDSQVLDSSVYEVDTVSDPGFVRLGYQQTWPTTRTHHDVVQIQYVAGFGDGPEDVPASIKLAIMTHAVMIIDNPSMLDYGQQAREVPQVFDRLIATNRNYLG